jgi:hypothetical protein
LQPRHMVSKRRSQHLRKASARGEGERRAEHHAVQRPSPMRAGQAATPSSLRRAAPSGSHLRARGVACLGERRLPLTKGRGRRTLRLSKLALAAP